MTVIRSPIRPVIFSPIRTATTLYKGGGLPWYPNRLFQSGDILLWYDPSDLTTMFKDTAGTQPVTADGDSVALMLDKGQWGGKTLSQVLAAQTELNGTETTGTFAGAAPTVDGDGYIIQRDTDSDPFNYVEIAATGWHRVNFTVEADATLAGNDCSFRDGSTALATYAPGTHSVMYNFAQSIRWQAAVGSSYKLTINSVKAIPGYHRVQATGTSMPKYKTDGTLHWLLYDGTDDGHATGTITWGTDEVAICAGVTKSSDAAIGVLVETSSVATTTNGAFAIFAPVSVADNYRFSVRGTALSSNLRSGFAAPNTAVLTAQADISADVNKFRVSESEASVTDDQGTGNFGSYPMYFGRRAGTSLPFNGREYQTVIRSRLLSAAELSKLETFVAAKTGVIL